MSVERPQLAWAIGLFEGEGCMSIEQGGRRVRITLNMTDEDVVRKFAAVVGMGTVTGPHNPPSQKGYKPKWIWRAGKHEDVRSFLMAAYSMLGERRRAKADEVLAYLDAQALKRQPRTHCGQGHELTPDNVLTRHDGKGHEYKRCRTCSNAWSRDYQREVKETGMRRRTPQEVTP